MATDKLSATVDAELLARVRATAGRRGLSSFVNRALRHELDRVELLAFLDELEAEIGPVDPELLADATAMLDELGRATSGGRSKSRGRRRA